MTDILAISNFAVQIDQPSALLLGGILNELHPTELPLSPVFTWLVEWERAMSCLPSVIAVFLYQAGRGRSLFGSPWLPDRG